MLLFTLILNTSVSAQVTIPYSKEFSPTTSVRKGYIFYKNAEELDKYFDCFKLPPFKLRSKEKMTLKIVAQHYNLPESFMACTLFVESRFNSQAISAAGANGIAQLMPETISTIYNLNSPVTKGQIKGCKKEKLNEEERSYCSALNEQQRYVAMWTELQGKLKSAKLIHHKIVYNPFSTVDSIAMSGMYLNFILNKIDQRSGLPQGRNMNERMIHEYKITLAAYNRGPGKVLSLIQRQKEDNGIVDLQQIVSEIRINKETADHMDGIEKCLTKNDFRQPISAIPEKTILCQIDK